MHPDPQAPAEGTGLWLQWADADGVRSDAEGKASYVVAMDNRETPDVYRVLLAPNRSGTTTFAQELAANLAYARALPIEASIGRRGGEIDFDVDPSQVFDPEKRIVPRRPMLAGGERSVATLVAGPRTARRANSCLPMAGFRP